MTAVEKLVGQWRERKDGVLDTCADELEAALKADADALRAVTEERDAARSERDYHEQCNRGSLAAANREYARAEAAEAERDALKAENERLSLTADVRGNMLRYISFVVGGHEHADAQLGVDRLKARAERAEAVLKAVEQNCGCDDPSGNICANCERIVEFFEAKQEPSR